MGEFLMRPIREDWHVPRPTRAEWRALAIDVAAGLIVVAIAALAASFGAPGVKALLGWLGW